MAIEIIKFKDGEKPLMDADGVAIAEGSVLRHVSEPDRGVVVCVKRPGDRGSCIDAVGDIHISTSPGSTRVTNQYQNWRHIPHEDQTYAERYTSWCYSKPYDPDGVAEMTSEKFAAGGIMALLPDDIVDEVYGPWPDDLRGALHYLTEHLTELKKGGERGH